MQAVAHAGGVTHRNGMRARDSLQWHVTHAGRLTHRNGMRAPGGDQGKLGCLPTVPIGVTGCKLAPWRGLFTTTGPGSVWFGNVVILTRPV